MANTVRIWQPVICGAAAVTLIALAGTGGDVRSDQITRHFGTGSVVASPNAPQVAASRQSLALELKLIRETLRLSVAETAQLFCVTRPTVYSWQNGNPISGENSERLRALASALVPHLNLLHAQVGRVAQRAIEGRTTLLQKLAAGADAHATVAQLVAILSREATQRERLARRLQGRAGNRGAADLDALG